MSAPYPLRPPSKNAKEGWSLPLKPLSLRDTEISSEKHEGRGRAICKITQRDLNVLQPTFPCRSRKWVLKTGSKRENSTFYQIVANRLRGPASLAAPGMGINHPVSGMWPIIRITNPGTRPRDTPVRQERMPLILRTIRPMRGMKILEREPMSTFRTSGSETGESPR